jgi:nicotinamide mononucleotide transporter
MTIPEVLGVLTGAICVVLVVRRSIWNFAFGILSSLFFAEVFWSSRLYWDMLLQGVFLALSAFGWLQWARGSNKEELPIRRIEPGVLLLSSLLVLVATPAMMRLSQEFGGAAPFWDSLTTALSLIAQWLLNRKIFENWAFWIAADLIYIPLYFSRQLYLTGVLYMLFLGLCILGWRAWRLELNAHELKARPA